VRNGDVVMYLVQILNKPRRIIALEVRHAFLILLFVKYVADLIVKPGRGLVEEAESLQGRGTN